MADQVSIGLNIKTVREERGKTQYDVSVATEISTSQLSAYENGKQMPGLVNLAKIAVALDTSLDRLYFGSPSEQFLNKSSDFGETVVNAFLKLHELGVVTEVKADVYGNGGNSNLYSCGRELERMFEAMKDFNEHKGYYPDADVYLAQICKSTVNEINEKKIPYGYVKRDDEDILF